MVTLFYARLTPATHARCSHTLCCQTLCCGTCSLCACIVLLNLPCLACIEMISIMHDAWVCISTTVLRECTADCLVLNIIEAPLLMA